MGTPNKELTLADHAELWWAANGEPMPEDKKSSAWLSMYEKWVDWAFVE